MKVKKILNRKEYIETEIKRSKRKFDYCKVSYEDVSNFNKLIKLHHKYEEIGPILCLGTRNGREIDLFRNIIFGNPVINMLIKILEVKRYVSTSLLPFFESFDRSNTNDIRDNSVIGVEINPDATRTDTHICSFDEMPDDWENKFKIIYSNSFDQSQDPEKTAQEWLRIASPGAIIILGFTYTPATDTDPVGEIETDDLKELFGGKIIYYSNLHGFYHNVAIQID